MHEDDATLADTAGATAAPARSTGPRIDARYDLGPVLGRGGMGEVRLARDTRIDREVAVKLMAGRADADTTARFFREAKVQGALEHPAVVPVHDLGIDQDGQPYFVMKRLAGTTLLDVLAHPDERKWPRRLLLARLVDVCLAIELAHTRGIVHRDLKPANIMLGDFGETYVLDWGLARITGDSALALAPISSPPEAGHTAAGAMLGTPGYMAPEQARGDAVDARADVFSLGCVLYEILVGAPALPRGMAGIQATLDAREHRPGARAADVPPELDDLCARATAQDPATRPSARQLAEGIQAYLDGDRDLERRRELAAQHLAVAQRALGAPDDEARARALREAGQAFALDPGNEIAQALLAGLVLAPPANMPAGARVEADRARGVVLRQALRLAAATYIALALMVLLLFVFTVHVAWPIVASSVLSAVLAGAYWALSRRDLGLRSPWYLATVALNTLLLIVGSQIFGPLLVFPIYVVGSLAGFLLAPVRHHPVPILLFHVLAMALPIVLELAGVFPSTFRVEGGGLVLAPYAVELTPASTIAILVLGTGAQLVNTTVLSLAQRRGLEGALLQVHAQSWHLKQLLPRADEPPRDA